MKRQDFLRVLAEALNEDADTVRFDTPLKSLAGWDSMGMLGLIAMLDEELNTTVEVDNLRKCETVGDVANLVADGLE